jgi:hypothetical protein
LEIPKVDLKQSIDSMQLGPLDMILSDRAGKNEFLNRFKGSKSFMPSPAIRKKTKHNH